MKDKDGNRTMVTDGIWKMKDLSQGSATTLVAALDPDILDSSGAYLADCLIDHNSPVMEELVGEKFEY
jgi:hypothetical protein